MDRTRTDVIRKQFSQRYHKLSAFHVGRTLLQLVALPELERRHVRHLLGLNNGRSPWIDKQVVWLML